MRIVKVLAIGVGAAVALAVVAVVGGLVWLQNSDVGGLVRWGLERQGYPVALQGPVRLKLWPHGDLTVGQVSVQGRNGSKLLDVDEAHVAWQWGGGVTPWKGLLLTELYAKNPTVMLSKDALGVANWDMSSKAADEDEAPKPAAGGGMGELPLGMVTQTKLNVENLNLTYDDKQAKRKVVAKNVNLGVSTTGTVAMTTLKGTVNDQAVDGAVQVDMADMDNVPVNAKVDAAGLKVMVDGKVLKQESFAGQVNAQTGNLKQTLTALLGQAPAQAPASEFKLVGDMTVGKEKLELRNFETHVGDLLQASGDASVAMGDKPSAEGKVRVQGSNLRALAELASGAAQPNVPASSFDLTTSLSGKDEIVLKDLRFSLANLLAVSGNVTVVPPAGGSALKADASLNLNAPNLQALAKSAGQTVQLPSQPLTGQVVAKVRDGRYDLPTLKFNIADVAAVEGNLSVFPGKQMEVDGDFKLSGSNVKSAAAAFGVNSANLPASAFKASASMSGKGTLTIADLVVDLPQLLEAKGKLDVTPGSPLNVNGTIDISKLNATALGYCAVTPAVASSAKGDTTSAASANATSPWTDDPIDLSALRGVAFDVTLNVKGIDCARFPVEAAAVKVVNTPSQLNVQRLDITLPNGGNASMKAQLDHAGRPSLSVEATTKALPVEQFLPAMKAKGVVLPVDMQAKLDTQGASTRALAQNLGGSFSLDSKDGKFPYTNMLGNVSSFAGVLQKLATVSGTASASTASNGDGDVDSLTARYTIRQGVASTDELKMSTGKGAMVLTGTGTIDIGRWAIDYKLTPTMNVAGGLAIPIVLNGPLTTPKIGPDTEFISKLSGRLTTEALKGALGVGKDDAKGVGAAVGDILSGKGVKGENVGNLLNGLLGGKKASGTTK
jgi:hypothetical protein